MDLHVRSVGSGDAGTIVFLHGFPFDGSIWDPQLQALTRGWRGIAPDLRGFGRTPLGAGDLISGSNAPGAIARPAEAILPMDVMAADVARLIERDVGQPTVICGLSMGGYVALALSRHRPDLVRGLILMDTRATADSDADRESRRKMAATARESGARPLAITMVHALLAPTTWETKPDVLARVRDMIQATAPRTLIAAAAGMAARPDASADLPHFVMPTLVIVGAEDDITPPDDARAMADAIPDARLEIVDGAGHLPGLEEPHVVNWLIADFLTTL